MAPSTPANHDPALSHGAPAQAAQQPPAQGGGMPPNLSAADLSSMHLNGLDQNQIMNLLRSLPGVFTKVRWSPVSYLVSHWVVRRGVRRCKGGGEREERRGGEGRSMVIYIHVTNATESTSALGVTGGRAPVLVLRGCQAAEGRAGA